MKDACKSIPLYPRSVAHFYDELMACLAVAWDRGPDQHHATGDPQPYSLRGGHRHASYDPDAVNRWWRILTSTSRVMWRAPLLVPRQGQPGPFVLGIVRPHRHPPQRGAGATPASRGGYIYRVAEDESNWAAGFWPGSGPVDYPAFYAYMYPQPDGLPEASIEPDGGVLECGDARVPVAIRGRAHRR